MVEFAEQFSADVSSVSDDLRGRFTSTLGRSAFPAVVLTYVADFLPRMRAGFEALGWPAPWTDTVAWRHDGRAQDVLFNEFLPKVAGLRELDALTTEVVRLRGARQHNCRMCKARRENDALEFGGSESLYEQIDSYDTSDRLTQRHKAALCWVDALIWTPAAIQSDVVAGVRDHFSEPEAFELTVDVMHNAANKIAVSLGADAA